MRVTAAFSRLLDLPGIWVRKVAFGPDRVVVSVVLRRKKLVCPKCSFSTMARETEQHHHSVWRHLDLGIWRLEIRAGLRRLRCPEHGVHVEGVPCARDGARFTRDFEGLVAWLMTKTDRTATCRLVRIDWETVGRIIKRVGDEVLPAERLGDLFEISLDEVAWRKGHKYLTLIGDHRQSCVVWGTEGKGQAVADEFLAGLDPRPAPSRQPRPPSEPVIMVPFGPCPTVSAGEGIPGGWPPPGLELDRQLLARASRLTAVSMDMTGGYAKSVREHAPQAEIVIDNYHVVALATKALDEVRRDHWNELCSAGAGDAAKAFKDARWSLLKNPEHLTDRQAATLAPLQTAGGKVPRTWAHKETVREIFKPGLSVAAVEKLIDGLLARLSRSRLQPFVRLGRSIRKYRDGILPAAAGAKQRSGGGPQQQGEIDRPPRVRVSLRTRPAGAHPPHLRPGHTHTATRPVRRVTSPTIIHGERQLTALSLSLARRVPEVYPRVASMSSLANKKHRLGVLAQPRKCALRSRPCQPTRPACRSPCR